MCLVACLVTFGFMVPGDGSWSSRERPCRIVNRRQEMLYYLSNCGKEFARIMEGYAGDVTRPLLVDPDGEFTTQLYQMELCTSALLLDKLEFVRGPMSAVLRSDVQFSDVQHEWDLLKREMQLCSLRYQRNWKEMAVYLYDIHSDYLREEGFDVSRIAQMLNIVEAETQVESEQDSVMEEDEEEEEFHLDDTLAALVEVEMVEVEPQLQPFQLQPHTVELSLSESSSQSSQSSL